MQPASIPARGNKKFLIFGFLSVIAFYLLFVQQYFIGLEKAFGRHCPPTGGAGIGIAAYRRYTGNHAFDYFMCMLVNVFTTALKPPARAVNVPFILSLPTSWLVLLIETASHFPDRPAYAIGVSTAWGMYAQVFGGGVVFPIFFAFAQSARSKVRANNLTIQAPSGPISKGIVLGTMFAVIPTTLLMVLSPTHTIITMWQPFPIYLAIIQASVLPWYQRELAHTSQKSTLLLRSALIITASIPIIPHFMFLRTILSSPEPLQTLISSLLPYPFEFQYASVEDLMTLGPDAEAIRFLKWDALFIYNAIWLGGAWSWAFSSMQTLRRAIVTSLLGGALFGPGVFMAYPYLIQLQKDEDERITQVGQRKERKN
ncbi:hypothetical protein DL93DRAFT_2223290 [Clavulina sp. PMI_390]|nr:hypothetical protein DL93DRAFT_2223290 [Clavulina sp. PMI_390]